MKKQETKQLELLTTEQAAMILGTRPGTLAMWRVTGDGPKFIKIGRKVRYLEADISQWLESRRFDSTAAAQGN